MPDPDPPSSQARERERMLLFAITSPLAAVALVFGFVSAPPLLLLSLVGLKGMIFAAILLWGNRRKRVRLATCVAVGFAWFGLHFIDRVFYGTPYHSVETWPAYFAELAVFWLGVALAFTLSTLWRSTPDRSESNV